MTKTNFAILEGTGFMVAGRTSTYPSQLNLGWIVFLFCRGFLFPLWENQSVSFLTAGRLPFALILLLFSAARFKINFALAT